MEWQPIETAPKDGSYFLAVKWDYRPAVVRWCKKAFCFTEGLKRASALDKSWGLSHWMPLPKPPAE